MKIVADENIPLVKHYFGSNQLLQKPGRLIEQNDLIDADILLVRSITPVNQALLEGTSVKFVGSPTSGTDHLDIAWLKQMNIAWSAAQGCNATAVADYVVCIIAALQKQGLLTGTYQHAGVIGVGSIGQLVVEKLNILGFHVSQCDPFRAENEPDFPHTSLEDLMDLDFITLHTPLTYHSTYPTHHLIEKTFLQRQKKGCILLNTGRGSVISFDDLKRHAAHLYWCLDVWEQEPFIDPDILTAALIATPHIAGYSLQSKYRGIQMIYHAALEHKILSSTHIPQDIPFPEKTVILPPTPTNWRDVVLTLYDPCQTTLAMKQALALTHNAFDPLRKNFAERYEFNYLHCANLMVSDDDQERLIQLGISP
jgi:erythronate-4-phosphate dehydrogenase